MYLKPPGTEAQGGEMKEKWSRTCQTSTQHTPALTGGTVLCMRRNHLPKRLRAAEVTVVLFRDPQTETSYVEDRSQHTAPGGVDRKQSETRQTHSQRRVQLNGLS